LDDRGLKFVAPTRRSQCLGSYRGISEKVTFEAPVTGIDIFLAAIGSNDAFTLSAFNALNVLLGITLVVASSVIFSHTNSVFIADDLASGRSATGVPEPPTLAPFGAGLFGLGTLRRRKAKA
jgi:hypothetical protein